MLRAQRDLRETLRGPARAASMVERARRERENQQISCVEGARGKQECWRGHHGCKYRAVDCMTRGWCMRTSTMLLPCCNYTIHKFLPCIFSPVPFTRPGTLVEIPRPTSASTFRKHPAFSILFLQLPPEVHMYESPTFTAVKVPPSGKSSWMQACLNSRGYLVNSKQNRVIQKRAWAAATSGSHRMPRHMICHALYAAQDDDESSHAVQDATPIQQFIIRKHAAWHSRTLQSLAAW